ncbi:MAG: hypothetical protein ABI462_05025 [Ignavibacteria bacterium]
MYKLIKGNMNFSRLHYYVLLIPFFYLTIAPEAYSITNSGDTTSSCNIATTNGVVYKKVNMFDADDSTVKILKNNYVKVIPVKDIRSITFQGHGFGPGALTGAAIAFGLGLLGGKGINATGDGTQEWKIGTALAIGCILAVPLLLIGGGIGALLADDKLYDLSELNFEDKRKQILFLIKEYSE